MKTKQTAFNTHLLLVGMLFVVFLGISVACAVEHNVVMSVVFAILELLPLFVFAISPLYVVFSEEYIEIVYNFGQRERIKWSDIRNIFVMGSWIGGGGFPRYVLSYLKKEKTPFFVCGEIPKTFRTTKLIKTYYQGAIK